MNTFKRKIVGYMNGTMCSALIVIIIACLKISESKAQISVGVKFNGGGGKYSSRDLKDLVSKLSAQSAQDSYNINSPFRLNTGLGGFAEYHINDKFSIYGELTFNYYSGRIHLNYLNKNQAYPDTMFQTRISSKLNVAGLGIEVPVMVRYLFYKKLYLTGGLQINYFLKPQLKSEEQFANSTYVNSILFRGDENTIHTKAKASSFNGFGLMLVGGIGKKFNIWERYIGLDIRYGLPLLKSSLATNNKDFSDQTVLNYVFTEQGQSDTKQDYPQFTLKDFKYSSLMLNFSYYLFHNKKSVKELQ